MAAQSQNSGKETGHSNNLNGLSLVGGGGGSSTVPTTRTSVTRQQSPETTSRSSTVADAAGSGDEGRSGPYVDVGASKNVTALLGKTAYLNCRVKNLGNKTVSVNRIQTHTRESPLPFLYGISGVELFRPLSEEINYPN